MEVFHSVLRAIWRDSWDLLFKWSGCESGGCSQHPAVVPYIITVVFATIRGFVQLFYLLCVTCQVERPNEPMINTASSGSSLFHSVWCQVDWYWGTSSQTIGLGPGAMCTKIRPVVWFGSLVMAVRQAGGGWVRREAKRESKGFWVGVMIRENKKATVV